MKDEAKKDSGGPRAAEGLRLHPQLKQEVLQHQK